MVAAAALVFVDRHGDEKLSRPAAAAPVDCVLAECGRAGYTGSFVGAWLSLVEHSVRDRGVGGSNPLAPTNSDQRNWPSIDRHGRLKAIFVCDSKGRLLESSR